MTDDTPPADDHDARDERLAGLLDVPPLDDVTRRRLVSRALAESGLAPARHRRAPRLIAVAAAALAVLVIGAGTALVLRDEDGGDTVAVLRRETTKSEAGEDAAEAAAPVSIGDLGDVSDAGVLRDRLRASAGASPTLDEIEAAAPATASPCVDAPRQLGATGQVTRVGTGTYDGVLAAVLVARRGQEQVAFVLDAGTCALLDEVPLV